MKTPKILKTIARGALLLMLPLMFSGCALFDEDVEITSFAAPGKFPQEFRYTLKPGNTSLSAQDLEFIRYAEEIDKMLVAKKYKRVPENEANCLVKVDFGVSEPDAVATQDNYPIYGTVGYVNTGRGVRSVSGVVGYDSHSRIQRIFTRHLSLECWSLNDGAPADQLWKTNAFSHGFSSDMKACFPLLALATFPWIAKDSDGQKIISEDPEDADKILKEEISKELGKN